MQLIDAWITGENNDDIQYTIIPSAQLDNSWKIGAKAYNFGTNTQNNLVYGVTYPFFTANDNALLLQTDSTVVFEQTFAGSLPAGLQSGDYGLTSDEENTGPEFGNNALNRKVQVMNAGQQIYAQDGVGIHDPAVEKYTEIGTNSIIVDAPSTADGMILCTQYKIHQQSEVSGLRIMLAEGSQVGGELYASIIDTVGFNDLSATALVSSLVHFISPADISNGYIDVFFKNVFTLDTGVYYAAVKLYSTSNNANVVVVDDRTLSQPEWASAVLFPGETISSAGNSLAIRVLMGADWGAAVNEGALASISLYPNPSQGTIYLNNPSGEVLKVRLLDLNGRCVYQGQISTSQSFDFSAFDKGVYLIELHNGTALRSERIVLQ